VGWDDVKDVGEHNDRKFLQWKDVRDGDKLRIQLQSEPSFDALVSQHGIVEFNAAVTTANGVTREVLVSVSSKRLAAALKTVAPRNGDTVEVTAHGSGVERFWEAHRA